MMLETIAAILKAWKKIQNTDLTFDVDEKC